jgi:hypothetical protein
MKIRHVPVRILSTGDYHVHVSMVDSLPYAMISLLMLIMADNSMLPITSKSSLPKEQFPRKF